MRSSATSSRPALVAASLLALSAAAESVERRLGVMGTSLSLEVSAADRAVALAASEAAVRAIEDTEARLSTWRRDTELSRLNRAPVGVAQRLSARTAADLEAALSCAQATEGAFDPTVGALVAAWDLRGRGRLPGDAALRLALARVGHAQVRVDAREATRRADVQLEEGGFGKGAALDWAAEALRQAGAKEAWVDLGGQVLALGREVLVPVAHPAERGRAVLQLALRDASLATTGNSERGLRVAGQRVGHVLDPRTGRPAPFVGSVTVLARQGVRADCLSTALFVRGPDAALAWARQEAGVEVLVLEEGPAGLRARASAGLRGLLRVAPGASVTLEFEHEGDAR